MRGSERMGSGKGGDIRGDGGGVTRDGGEIRRMGVGSDGRGGEG